MENKFTEHELLGRTIFNEFLEKNKATNIKFTNETFNHIDVYFTFKGEEYACEIKYRKNYSLGSNLIQKDGIILEKTKYDALKEKQAEGYIPLYVSIFKDKEMAIAVLTDKTYNKWEDAELPKTTCGNNTKITKSVTKVPIEDCILVLN